MYPTLRRGGMTWAQLCGVLRARAQRRGVGLDVDLCPWPDRGAVERFGNLLVVYVDSRQSKGDQLRALAHEAGHVLLGHYQLEQEVWFQIDTGPDNPWEAEADWFADFALRTAGTPPEWFIGEQLDLAV